MRVSNSLSPDQTRRFVGSNLGPIWLQKLSIEDKVAEFKLTIKYWIHILHVLGIVRYRLSVIYDCNNFYSIRLLMAIHHFSYTTCPIIDFILNTTYT